jgi:glycosyltransferase involved in cell wall biosynthesis
MSRGRVVIFGWADSAHVARWAHGLTARGFEITVISVGGEPIEEIPTIIYPRRGKLAYVRRAGRAARDVASLRPDLIHCHYAAGFGLWTLALRHHPTLVSVWGSDVINVSGPARWLVRRTLRKADWITATGEFLRKAACDILPEAESRMSVIPFGVTPVDPPPPLPQRPVRLCFLKEHRPIYGPDLLLEAFALARQKVGDLRLTLAGGGDMSEQLKNRARELGMSEVVEFPGYIDHRTVVSFLSTHHILVMPSRMESFGVVALEASACARPVIATRVGGIPEVVRDGETGLLVPPENVPALAEAIVRLATDHDLSARLGRTGYKFVQERYRWDKCLDQMCELYDRLIYDAKKNPIL